MAITHVHVFTVGSTQYDLRKTVSWYPHATDATILLVKFQDNPHIPIELNKAAFEAAKAASLAATGG